MTIRSVYLDWCKQLWPEKTVHALMCKLLIVKHLEEDFITMSL